VGTENTYPVGMAFNHDGTRLYVLGETTEEINVYQLTTPYSIISGVSFLEVFDIGAGDYQPNAMHFNADGTQLFILGSAADDIRVYDISEGVITNDIDGDGIINSLDLDSDNDGITDNVEAQATQGYKGPSGIDVNGDGLDDTYVGGITATDTDSDGTADYKDSDADNDGILDIAERGDGAPTTPSSTTDTDGDGLLDIFEGADNSDGYDVNDENVTVDGSGNPISFNLSDSDADAAVDGSSATGIIINVDFREDASLDTDGDNIANSIDLDDDNDGILDIDETKSAIGDNAFNVASASFNNSQSFGAVGEQLSGLAFDTDGSKAYVIGISSELLKEYSLSTPFDLTSGTLLNTLSLNGQSDDPQSIVFNNSGSTMFIYSAAGKDVDEYDLSTAFDTSTSTYQATHSVNDQGGFVHEIVFNTDGTKMYNTDSSNDRIYEYNLATAYDISTKSLAGSLAVGTWETQPTSIAFNHDGTQLFLAGYFTNDITIFNVTTPYSITSGVSYASTFSVNSQVANAEAVRFNNDGTQMYIVDRNSGEVHTYDIASGTIDNDIDGDGIINSLDLDSDNDGIADNIEAQSGAAYIAPTYVDANADGLDDAYAAGLSPINTDGSDYDDYLDTNSDNDDKLDAVESGLAATTDATYADVNGSTDNPAGQLTDTNAGGEADYRDASVTPLMLDLDGDGVETLSLENGVNFDIDADGKIDRTGWVGADDALLVWDKNNNGLIDDASELFGEHSVQRNGEKASDGFAALADLDSNADGVFDRYDSDYAQLQLWQDANSDAQVQAHELLTLQQAGVESISLAAQSISEQQQGNWLGLRASWTDAQGTQQDIDDVWLNYESGVAVTTEFANNADLSSFMFPEQPLYIDVESLVKNSADQDSNNQPLAPQDIAEIYNLINSELGDIDFALENSSLPSGAAAAAQTNISIDDNQAMANTVYGQVVEQGLMDMQPLVEAGNHSDW